MTAQTHSGELLCAQQPQRPQQPRQDESDDKRSASGRRRVGQEKQPLEECKYPHGHTPQPAATLPLPPPPLPSFAFAASPSFSPSLSRPLSPSFLPCSSPSASLASSAAAAVPALVAGTSTCNGSNSARRLRYVVELSARHLPPGLSPLACLLLSAVPTTTSARPANDDSSDDNSGREVLVGHTEVVRSAMSPHWQRLLLVERGARSGQTVRIALFDAAHIGAADEESSRVEQPHTADTTRSSASSGDSSRAVLSRRRSSLLDRLLPRRLSALSSHSGSVSRTSSGAADALSSSSSSSSAAASSTSASTSSSLTRLELRSEDAIGCALLPLDDLCHALRFHVQQRLPLRHTFDSDIDKRLQRLNAHLLVTVRPEQTTQPLPRSPSHSATHSPRLSGLPALSWRSGPSCTVPFDAAYRLLCRGAEMWKFAYSSNKARPQRRLVFYAPHPLTAAQLQLAAADSVDLPNGTSGAVSAAAPNPLFPLGLLYWCRPGKRLCDSARCVPLHSVTALYERCQTAAFASILRERERLNHRSIRPAAPGAATAARQPLLDSLPLELGFSVVSPQRTLDLLPDSAQVRDVFLAAIHGILLQHARICYEDNREARMEEAKRTEERRRYNERQLEAVVAVSFSLKHLPLPAASPDTADTQIRLVLSRQLPSDGGASAAAITASIADDAARSVLVGCTEWVDVEDEVSTFAHVFSLPLPTSSPTSTPSSAEQYHLCVEDLSHRTLGTATFSALLLFHHHLDIPLAVRHHTVQSVDSLLTFNRTCASMRVTPLAGRDTGKADILDVITLLQAQPAPPADLPYLTLSFLLRGEQCDYFHAPSYVVQRTTLRYNHDTHALHVADHALPLSSLVNAHRQLRPASELTAALCAVHPEWRVNSRRVVVLHTADSGSFVCEMRSVLAADAWVTGVRQLMAKRETALSNRAVLEHEQLNWAKFDNAALDPSQQHSDDSDNDEAHEAADSHSFKHTAHSDAAGAAIDAVLNDSFAFVLDENGRPASGDLDEESELRVTAAHPTRPTHASHPSTFLSFASPLNGLLPLHSLADADDDDDEDGSDSGSDSDSDSERGSDSLADVDVDLADGHLVPRPSKRSGRRLSHSSGLSSPFIHSRSASFSSLQLPGFHLTPPASPSASRHSEEAEPDPFLEVELPNDPDIPLAPPLLAAGDDVPCAPPFDVPPAPPMGDDGTGQQPPALIGSKLKKLHWDALSGAEDARGTIFEQLDGQLDQSTIDAIEQLFAAVAPQKASSDDAAAQAASDAAAASLRAVELIDRRRAQNVSIALRGLKLSVDELVRALVECDLSALSVERLQQLIACLPDAVEAKLIKAYTGDAQRLGPAEQFMRATLSLPRCAVRLQMLLFIATFDDAVAQLSAHCSAVTAACDALRGSERLAAAMQGVLAVGGLLSGKRASGFRVSSLDKLHALKAQQQQPGQHSHSHGQLSLLDFIVEREVSRAAAVAAAHVQTDELSAPSADRLFFASLDTDQLSAAAKLDWQAVQADVSTLQEQLKAVRREMDRTDDGKQQQPAASHAHSHSRSSSSQLPAGGQAALHRVVRAFLGRAMPAFHTLAAQLASCAAGVRLTQTFFAEPTGGSPQSLFAALERFVHNFSASERRYWHKRDAEHRRRAIEIRKQQMDSDRRSKQQQKQGSAGTTEDGHLSYVEAKHSGSSDVGSDELRQPAHNTHTLDARITYVTQNEQSTSTG